MRELSVVGPAPTPSSLCTHCLSGSCDQHSGHKEVGTLLNSPGQGLLGVTSSCGLQERQETACHSEHTHEMSTMTLKLFVLG